VVVTLKDGLLRRFTSRAVAYGSVLYDFSREGEDALSALLSAYVKTMGHEVLFTELRNLSDLGAAQPILDDAGFIYEDHLDYLIDVDKPVEEVMRAIRKHTRKNIRAVERRGEVLVEEVRSRDLWPVCYELLRKTYANAQVPLADYSLFEAAFEVLGSKGMLQCMVARVGDAYVAISIDLSYKDIVYGWYGGVDRAYGSYNPNAFLTWRVLEWAATHGYRTYDFGGAGKPDEAYGVRDFKAKFGGELVCFGRNTCVHAPLLLNVGKFGYAIYRRML